MREMVENLLTERGFRVVMENVWGRIVRPNICLRFYIQKWDSESKLFLMQFVTRRDGEIVKIASERRLGGSHFGEELLKEHLTQALDEWQVQLSEEDVVCNKCGGSGKYVWISKSKVRCSGSCNRCNGKGYQDFSDRRRNFGYDRYIETRTEEVGETEHGTYADWVPHWVPTPENLTNKDLLRKRKDDN